MVYCCITNHTKTTGHKIATCYSSEFYGSSGWFTGVAWAYSRGCVPLEGQQGWKAQNANTQMSCSWYHTIGYGTSHTLHVAADPHPQAELASSHGILRAGCQESKGGSCKAS